MLKRMGSSLRQKSAVDRDGACVNALEEKKGAEASNRRAQPKASGDFNKSFFRG